jgi:cobyrinic acid a,c-diamide synthase
VVSQCPALLVSAASSRAGKTSLTAGLARLHAPAGLRVRVFKCGPDFLDPQLHEAVTGAPCHTLDPWMCGEEEGRARLAAAAGEADLILVEGVMGLYDGVPSTADIARRYGLPVLLVLDASSIAQTFGALAHGLATFQPGLTFHGVLANRVGSPGHARILEKSLPPGLRFWGAVERDEAAKLPERHLGLVSPGEQHDVMARVDLLADHLARTWLVEAPPALAFPGVADRGDVRRPLEGRSIAVARDAAFSFVYPGNLETLRALGAELRFFSPLAFEPLPECDAVWLPGGYPELHAESLAAHTTLWKALEMHAAASKPLVAECGGMMVLFERLVGLDGRAHAMAGLLPGVTTMHPRVAALGHQEVALPEGVLRGHTFHCSSCESSLDPATRATRPDGRPGEAIFRTRRVTASYVHLYFPSNPEATAGLFGAATPPDRNAYRSSAT